MDTETVTTSQLHTGDVVHAHGLRVRLGTKFAEQKTQQHGIVHAFDGTILNPEILATPDGRKFAGLIPADGSDLAWTIQGNDRMTWARETRTATVHTDFDQALEQFGWRQPPGWLVYKLQIGSTLGKLHIVHEDWAEFVISIEVFKHGATMMFDPQTGGETIAASAHAVALALASNGTAAA